MMIFYTSLIISVLVLAVEVKIHLLLRQVNFCVESSAEGSDKRGKTAMRPLSPRSLCNSLNSTCLDTSSEQKEDSRSHSVPSSC